MMAIWESVFNDDIFNLLVDMSHKYAMQKNHSLNIFPQEMKIYIRDVEAVKFLIFPLPAPLEVLCFRVRFRFLTFGIFRFHFQLRIELVASKFASASSLFYQNISASSKI